MSNGVLLKVLTQMAAPGDQVGASANRDRARNFAFKAKATERFKIGKTYIDLYPAVTQKNPANERSHAFHVNIGAVNDSDVNIRESLAEVAKRMGCLPQYTHSVTMVMNRVDDCAFDPTLMSDPMYHDRAGAHIADAYVAGTSGLRPITGIPNASRRPNGVSFMSVTSRIHFEGISFSVRHTFALPYTTRNVTDGADPPTDSLAYGY